MKTLIYIQYSKKQVLFQENIHFYVTWKICLNQFCRVIIGLFFHCTMRPIFPFFLRSLYLVCTINWSNSPRRIKGLRITQFISNNFLYQSRTSYPGIVSTLILLWCHQRQYLFPVNPGKRKHDLTNSRPPVLQSRRKQQYPNQNPDHAVSAYHIVKHKRPIIRSNTPQKEQADQNIHMFQSINVLHRFLFFKGSSSTFLTIRSQTPDTLFPVVGEINTALA